MIGSNTVSVAGMRRGEECGLTKGWSVPSRPFDQFVLLAAPQEGGEDWSERYVGQPKLGAWMDHHARIDDQLAAVPLFEGLSKKQLRRISSLMTRLDRPAGQVLTREGQQGYEFLIVLEGEVEVRQGDRVLATRGPGEYVGEIALLDQRPRTATVVASTPVSVEVLGSREFVSLLAEAPELSEQIMATMAQRLADLETQAPTG